MTPISRRMALQEWGELMPDTREAISLAASDRTHSIDANQIISSDGIELVNMHYFRKIGDGKRFAITQHAFALHAWSKQDGSVV